MSGNHVDARRQQIEQWFQGLGFQVTVPKPEVSNHDFDRREKTVQQLFYRPSLKDVSYDAFMKAVGQERNWTVTDEAMHEKIGWEPVEQGYWFWAEIWSECPRLGETWHKLNKTVRLLALEEYVIIWWATNHLTGQMLDRHRSTMNWLRTRYDDDGAMACESDAGVVICKEGARGLFVPHRYLGGRTTEVVTNGA